MIHAKPAHRDTRALDVFVGAVDFRPSITLCRCSYAPLKPWAAFLTGILILAFTSHAPAQTYEESVLYAPTSAASGFGFFAPLVQAGDGSFYSVVLAYSDSVGTGSGIFKVSPSGSAKTVYRVPTNYSTTRIGLTAGSDGELYGVLTNGGSSSTFYRGLIFKVSPFGEFTVLHTFSQNPPPSGDSPDGMYPDGVLVQGSDGDFYGTTLQGGANPTQAGTIFKITPTGQFTTIYSFCSEGGSACTDGLNPEAGLVQGIDGNFYGTTTQGGLACPAATGTVPGCGTIFKITPTGTYAVIHRFTGGRDGSFPGSRLVQGADGNFYGTTQGAYQRPGQPLNGGTVFRMTPSGEITTIYGLSGGQGNESGLFLGSDGSFYGTDYSGSGGRGSIYRISTAGKGIIAYSFMNSPDGAAPDAQPLQGADGSIYGTTLYGGNILDLNYVSGTVYKLTAIPAFRPPVVLALSKQSIQLGEQVTVNWSVANAYSMTMQQCYASVQGLASGAGNWTGQQKGAFDSAKTPPYSGTATISPTANGTFTYALTCGGMESGFASLTVGGEVASPGFSPPGGAYTQPQEVSIVDSTPGATIYFTLDGSTPTDKSTRYTGAFVIAKSTTLKAIASGSNLANSAVATATYVILKPQTIAFTAPASPVTYGVKPITLIATASSGLPVAFNVVSGPGRVSGTTLTITGAGTVVVVAANQAGNAVYSAAPQITHAIVVNRASQTISFTQPASPVTYGAKTITLAATATSGLPVTFSVLSGPAKSSGPYLVVTGAGTVVVAADQAGSANYTPAAEVRRTISVNKAKLTVAANNLSMKQGAKVPALTYAMSGFVNGNTQSSATTGQPKLATTATSSSKPGTYPISVTIGTLAAANYSFVTVDGTLTVTP